MISDCQGVGRLAGCTMLVFRLAARQVPRLCLFILVSVLALGTGGRCETTSTQQPLPRPGALLNFDALPEDRRLHADHYPASNERRIDLFQPHIANLGGGYIGVGTDQNFTFIAWARSEYAWLMDFDYVAVDVNRIHMFFFRISPTFAEFRAKWDPKNKKAGLELLKNEFGAQPDFYRIQNAWKVAHRGSSDVPERMRDLDLMMRKFKLSTFANQPADYDYIRKLILEDRIIAVPGDLNGVKTMTGIAAAARASGMPIRLLYTSNAEEYLLYPPNMRANMQALPVDEKSLVIRTLTSGAKVLGYPEGEKFPEEFPFHYNIQPLRTLQSWMSFPTQFRVREMVKHNRALARGLSIQEQTPSELGLSATPSRGQAAAIPPEAESVPPDVASVPAGESTGGAE